MIQSFPESYQPDAYYPIVVTGRYILNIRHEILPAVDVCQVEQYSAPAYQEQTAQYDPSISQHQQLYQSQDVSGFQDQYAFPPQQLEESNLFPMEHSDESQFFESTTRPLFKQMSEQMEEFNEPRFGVANEKFRGYNAAIDEEINEEYNKQTQEHYDENEEGKEDGKEEGKEYEQTLNIFETINNKNPFDAEHAVKGGKIYSDIIRGTKTKVNLKDELPSFLKNNPNYKTYTLDQDIKQVRAKREADEAMQQMDSDETKEQRLLREQNEVKEFQKLRERAKNIRQPDNYKHTTEEIKIFESVNVGISGRKVGSRIIE